MDTSPSRCADDVSKMGRGLLEVLDSMENGRVYWRVGEALSWGMCPMSCRKLAAKELDPGLRIEVVGPVDMAFRSVVMAARLCEDP